MKNNINDYLISQNKQWTKTMTIVPKEQWPYHPEGLRKVWRSDKFLAQIYEANGAVGRISVVKTTISVFGDWNDKISWDDLMKVKAECGYEDMWAIEIYPPKGEVVNVANMRHLFILPVAPECAWRKKHEI